LKKTLRTALNLLILFLIFGCKNNQKKANVENEIKNKSIIELKEKKETINSILKIENDSLLLTKFIEIKTNEIIEKLKPDLEPGEDYFKYQNINGGEIIYSTDSILKVINIFGEYSGGATYNPYSEYYIFGKNKIISSGNGKVSKLNYISKKEYLIYINDYSRMGDDINKYYLTFRKDSIILNKFLNHTNKNK